MLLSSRTAEDRLFEAREKEDLLLSLCTQVEDMATDPRFAGDDWQIELKKALAHMIDRHCELEVECEMEKRAYEYELKFQR